MATLNDDRNINDLTGDEARAVLYAMRQACVREGYDPKKGTLLSWILANVRARKRLEG